MRAASTAPCSRRGRQRAASPATRPTCRTSRFARRWGVRIRDAFTASPGRRLVVADYSQIELRILAHMTGEPSLVESFTSGEDIHTRTAAEVFDVRMESVTPELSGGPRWSTSASSTASPGFGLATRLGNVIRPRPSVTSSATSSATRRLPISCRRPCEEAEELGYSTTLFGRRRYVPELRNSNKNVRKLGERIAFNARVQGTAADIIKVAMVDLAPRLELSGGRHDHAGPRRARL